MTNEQIVELVKIAFPEWKGGVYASDAAYTREEGTGKLIPRGKTAYGDGVLEYLSENSFKVLATEQIVRRPSSKKAPSVPKTEAKKEAAPAVARKKEAAKAQAKPPVATKQKGADRHAAQ